MTYQGRIQAGAIVLDEPSELPEGARVRCALTVVEEPSEVESAPSDARKPNGDWLADMIEQWDIESREQLVEKFGPPEAWQREQRQERRLPGRGGA